MLSNSGFLLIVQKMNEFVSFCSTQDDDIKNGDHLNIPEDTQPSEEDQQLLQKKKGSFALFYFCTLICKAEISAKQSVVLIPFVVFLSPPSHPCFLSS